LRTTTGATNSTILIDKLKPEERKKRIEENRAMHELPEEVWSAIELPKPEPLVCISPFLLFSSLLSLSLSSTHPTNSFTDISFCWSDC
jgi:hypothetical protein